MKTSLWVIIAALSGFVAGLLLHRIQRSPAQVAGPGLPLLSEVSAGLVPQPVRVAIGPEEIARLEKELVKIRQDTERFRGEFRELDATFRSRVEAQLTVEQVEKLKLSTKRPLLSASEPVSRPLTSVPPAGTGDILMSAPLPLLAAPSPASADYPAEMLHSILELTFVSWSVENLRTELLLSEEQTARIRPILLERRERFLELVDRLPPPTLRLLNVGRELKRRQIVDPPSSQPSHPKK